MNVKHKWAAVLLAVLLCLGLAACGNNNDNAEMANPITEYGSPEEAFSAAGVKGILPEYLPEGYEYQAAITIGGSLAQVSWQNGEDEVSLRVAKDSEEDITGDYNAYEYEETLEGVNSYVTVKGVSMDEIYQATWKLDNLQYALLLEVGVPQEVIMDIVNSQP